MAFTKSFLFPILIIIILTGFLSACGRIQANQQKLADINIELSVEPTQPAVGPAQLVVIVTDAAGRPINNANLQVEGNMTHAGMVPVLAQATAGENGRYTVPFEWTMGGDWIVTVTATLPDGSTAEEQFDLQVIMGDG